MDFDALKLSLRWCARAVAKWYRELWHDYVDSLVESSKLLMYAIRFVFSPIICLLILYKAFEGYRSLISGEVDRVRLRAALDEEKKLKLLRKKNKQSKDGD